MWYILLLKFLLAVLAANNLSFPCVVCSEAPLRLYLQYSFIQSHVASCTPLTSVWMKVRGGRGRSALHVGCVYMTTDSTSVLLWMLVT